MAPGALGPRPVRRAIALAALALLVAGTVFAVSGPAPAQTLSGPGPFHSLAKGDAWFFNRGMMPCWTGTSPKPGCTTNTLTLKYVSREYFTLGETQDRLTTPNLSYVQFTAPDPLIACDLKKAGCYGNAVHCSAVRYQLIVDGKVVVATGSIGPGSTSGVLALPRSAIRAGEHIIRVRMLGNPSGCAGNEDTQAGTDFWLRRSWGVALWLWQGSPHADLEGVVLDEGDTPQAGVQVVAHGGPSGGAKTYTRTTNAVGAYSFTLPAGSYDVTPRSDAGGPAFRPEARKVLLGSDVSGVNFVRRHDELDLRTASTAYFQGLDWTRLDATATAVEAGSATLENVRGEPRVNQLVTVDAPYWDGHFGEPGPRLLVCDDHWRRVYPGDGFQRHTDAAGRVDFTIFFGGEPGNWLLHAREAADVRAFDVLRIGQTGSVSGPNKAIVDTLQQSTKLGIPAPLAAGTLQAVQAGLIEWLLVHGQESLVTASLAQAGAFAPIRNAAGTQAGIVFYPAGDPAGLRAHLESRTALPYTTFVIPFKHVVLPYPSLTSPLKHIWYTDFGGSPWTDPTKGPPQGKDVPTLAQWEATNGVAQLGYAPAQSGEGLAWLGAPQPPPATEPTLRAGYERCAPGAAPRTTSIEVHSPLRLELADAAGLRFGYDAKGAAVNVLGGVFVRGGGTRPDRYIVPSGTYTATLRGTGSGRATLVVTSGQRTRVFAFPVGGGTTGSLRLTAAGAATSLRFAGRRVAARSGVGLALRALPASVRAKRYATLRPRVLDQFGASVANATVTVRGAGITATAATTRRGTTSLKLWPRRTGTLKVTAAAPGHAAVTRTVRVRR